MDTFIKTALVTAVLIFCYCQLTLGQTQEQRLEVLNSVPSDESFIGNIVDLVADKNEIFVSDYQKNEILVYSKDGTLLRRIGDGVGEGPGELFRVFDICLRGDSLFVANDGNGRFDLFHRDGQFIETYAQRYVFTSDFTVTSDGSLYGSAYSRGEDNHLLSENNRLLSQIGRDGSLTKRFGDMYFEDENVVFLTSLGSIHQSEGRFIYVPTFYETVRVFEDTTETRRFDIYNETLDEVLANNKDLEQFRPAVDYTFPLQDYIHASAVHESIVYAAFREPDRVRIMAYTVEGEPHGNYIYGDIQHLEDLRVRALDVDDDGIYLGLEDNIPKILVFAHPDE
ncbi:MAG: 6-bladed beta-propeller [Longimonas sp.]|uniref:6-bladed beta-propeller n=1 Tax=Longimonas sp. TaxID=2039626 RepID=UPI003363F8AC